MIPRALLALFLIPLIVSYLTPHLPSFLLTYRPLVPTLFFTFAYNLTGISMLLLINQLAGIYGFFDGDVKRDVIPDARLNGTMLGVVVLTVMRPIVGSLLLWNAWEANGGASGWDLTRWGWWALGLPFRLFLCSVVMDFWFYVSHRSMHEIPWLWKYHRVHHMAKHPIPTMSAFGDWEHNVLDAFIVPTLALLTYKVDFGTWWFSSLYTLFNESASHSGVRVLWRAPVSGWPLSFFGMDQCTEDHELHHRIGWRKSFNYGKQTRIWDAIFGTKGDRIETKEECLDL